VLCKAAIIQHNNAVGHKRNENAAAVVRMLNLPVFNKSFTAKVGEGMLKFGRDWNFALLVWISYRVLRLFLTLSFCLQPKPLCRQKTPVVLFLEVFKHDFLYIMVSFIHLIKLLVTINRSMLREHP